MHSATLDQNSNICMYDCLLLYNEGVTVEQAAVSILLTSAGLARGKIECRMVLVLNMMAREFGYTQGK